LRKTSEDLTLDDMREILGVPTGALTRWFDFRRFALDAAIAEINDLAGFRAAYQPIKRGRKVAGVRLVWGRKAGDKLIEANKVLERHRTGRTARRDDKVEAQLHKNTPHCVTASPALLQPHRMMKQPLRNRLNGTKWYPHEILNRTSRNKNLKI
jgi:plasmid replication initiation protein